VRNSASKVWASCLIILKQLLKHSTPEPSAWGIALQCFVNWPTHVYRKPIQRLALLLIHSWNWHDSSQVDNLSFLWCALLVITENINTRWSNRKRGYFSKQLLQKKHLYIGGLSAAVASPPENPLWRPTQTCLKARVDLKAKGWGFPFPQQGLFDDLGENAMLFVGAKVGRLMAMRLFATTFAKGKQMVDAVVTLL